MYQGYISRIIESVSGIHVKDYRECIRNTHLKIQTEPYPDWYWHVVLIVNLEFLIELYLDWYGSESSFRREAFTTLFPIFFNVWLPVFIRIPWMYYDSLYTLWLPVCMKTLCMYYDFCKYQDYQYVLDSLYVVGLPICIRTPCM